MIQVKLDKKAKNVIAKTADFSGEGGPIIVNELPKVGELHTVYELHQGVPADFPWLLTEFDTSTKYPTMNIYQAVVVENEEDVTQEYLEMPNDFLGYDDCHCIVYVKNTGNVYDCNIYGVEVVGEESPYEFSKTQLELITDKTGNKYYEVGKI